MIGSAFSLKQIEALVWVADLGTFRKAAERLNTTQPNISARIAGLEESLGITLMHRSSGAVTLTEQGRDVLRAAREVLRDAEGVLEAAKRSDLITDRLRLGVTEMVACTWLHDYLRRLRAEYPGLAVELTVDLAIHIDAALDANALDLALQTAPFHCDASGEIPLGEAPYSWVACPAIAALMTGEVPLSDLLPHGLLTHARHTAAVSELIAHAEQIGIPARRITPCSSLSATVQMACDGLGAALLPRGMTESARRTGQLQELAVDWLPAPLHFAARYRAERVPTLVARAAEIAAEVARSQS